MGATTIRCRSARSTRPRQLWQRFDRAVAELGGPVRSQHATAVGRADGDLAEITTQLASAVESEDRDSGLPPTPTSKI